MEMLDIESECDKCEEANSIDNKRRAHEKSLFILCILAIVFEISK